MIETGPMETELKNQQNMGKNTTQYNTEKLK